MTRLVIDAQLVNGYFAEAVLGKAPKYTGSTAALFARLGDTDIAYLDKAGKVEAEWRGVVDDEWFAEWLGDLLADGGIEVIDVPPCDELANRLRDRCGFDDKSTDRWYLCTARALVSRYDGRAVVVSEDLDFYEPKDKQKSAKTRNRRLTDCSGCVAAHLRRKEKIDVRCVQVHLAS